MSAFARTGRSWRLSTEDIRDRLAEAATADVVLSTGGVSVGEFDFVKEALDALGVERRFWKVAQKPGKPLTFGTRGERLFFGLPGNPVSALVCFAVYVRPALRRLGGHRHLHLPVIDATLATAVKKATKLTEFVRVWLSADADGWSARPAASQSSGVLTSLGRARGSSSGRPRRRRSTRARATRCSCCRRRRWRETVPRPSSRDRGSRPAGASQHPDALRRGGADGGLHLAHQLVEVEDVRALHEHLAQAPERGEAQVGIGVDLGDAQLDRLRMSSSGMPRACGSFAP